MSFIGRMIDVLTSKARWVIVGALVLTVVAAMIASRLSLEADLERLLPETAPSVRGMSKLEAAYGPIGRLTLVLEGDDTDALEAAAEGLGTRIRTMDRVKRTEWKRPVEFFETYRFLYADLEDLETARDRIVKRLRWEKQRANPLFADIGSSKPPTVDLSDIEGKYAKVGRDTPYFRSRDGGKYLVFVYLDFSPSDLDTTTVVLDAIDANVREVLAAEHAGVTMEMTGRYKKRIDQTGMLENDLQRATLVAFVMLLAFLLLYFRSLMAPLLVVLPLLMGTIWAFAWAQLVFGSLNILTGFFGAVILGLGIDYGIHLMSRYLEARQAGESLRDSLESTISSAGRASVFAGVTTVVAFGSLAGSHFRAFHEYGVIALGGMTLIIVCAIVVLPALLAVVADTPFEPRFTRREASAAAPVAIPGALRIAMVVVLAGLLFIALLSVGNTRFEYDFRKVFSTNLPSWKLDEEVDQILELSQIPAVILAESDAHAAAMASEVRKRGATLAEGRTLDSALTVQDVLPGQQPEKVAVLEEIEKEFSRLPKRVIKGQIAELRAEIAGVLKTGGVTVESLPESIRQPFARIDQPLASVVLVFPAVEMHDARDMRDFAVIIRDLPGPTDGVTVDAISEALLMVDIMEFVTVDSAFMIGITLVGLFLTAFAAFRDPRRVAVLVGTLAMSIFVALGMVDFFDVAFNFVNVLIWPIWLGLGVDAAFHLMVRSEESPGDLRGFMGTMAAVAAAFGTSMIGFGSMLMTDHSGLASLGAVAVIGLASIFVTSALLQGLIFTRSVKNPPKS